MRQHRPSDSKGRVINVDVCVIGGGPAGSVTALRLAKLGHRVGLVERHAFPRYHVGESLTKGIWAIIDLLELRDTVLRAGYLDADRASIRWSQEYTEAISRDQSGIGLLVDRARFDAHLLSAAKSTGVGVIQPAQAREASRDASGWTVRVDAGSESCWIHAPYFVDASGRSRFLRGRCAVTSPPTVALCGYFSNDNPVETPRVEAVPDGWCWGAPIPGSLFSTMVFLDHSAVRNRRGEELERLWRSQLETTELFNRLAQRPLVRPLRAYSATTEHSLDPVGENFVRVGEASLSLDPLSSTGVERAMQSGCRAAIALHTMIRWPERRELCVGFCRDRHLETVTSHTAWALEFYGAVKRYGERPFWRARSESRGPAPQLSLTPSEREFKSVSQSARVRVSSAARFVDSACIVGDEILAHSALVHPSLTRPVAFVEGLPLKQLLAFVPSSATLGSLRALWSTRIPTAKADGLSAWLLENQILEVVK
ncbi:MAG TPA: NAD(P)/FAD-dependent oxidoreductase [Gemmatimonadaceae bacterium]|nr:NAD(P)/FAD-dependent oxidoreductase [Gemmatimonadaceae bacterium]